MVVYKNIKIKNRLLADCFHFWLLKLAKSASTIRRKNNKTHRLPGSEPRGKEQMQPDISNNGGHSDPSTWEAVKKKFLPLPF
jgi:hypothetical protein